jgi:hypothetical protein
MSEFWAAPMLITAGLFAGGVVSIAWERIPAWREAKFAAFRPAFAHTLRRMDRLQPALLVTCVISTVAFLIGASGMARIYAAVAGAGFLCILAGSGAWLVPVQRRLVASAADVPSPELQRLKSQWLRGHVIRTVVAMAALAFAAAAALA